MMFSKEVLQKAADAGSQEVSKAFGKLSGKEVEVATSVAEVVSYDFIAESLHSDDAQTLITYAQVIQGSVGAAILTISRESALVLVDLLTQKEVGSTGILMDLDRSAVKETLNILSNAYLNALAKITNTELIIGSPYLMPASHVYEIFKKLNKKMTSKEEQMLLFKTVLEITEYKINVQLHIVFDEQLALAIK
jgi:chemotaxis protein CheY-P-specific phosphatase CheC